MLCVYVYVSVCVCVWVCVVAYYTIAQVQWPALVYVHLFWNVNGKYFTQTHAINGIKI